jgi:DNA-binding LacI/PurR family transcriptional regulator
VKKLIQVNDWSRDGAKILTKRLLTAEEPPTAIFATSDNQAIGVIEAVEESG